MEFQRARKWLILTEDQYRAGYCVLTGTVVVDKPYELIGRTPEGFYVVADPAEPGD